MLLEVVLKKQKPKLKPVLAEKAKENMLATQKNESATAFQKSDKQINTDKEVAKVAGVSFNKLPTLNHT